MRTVQKYETGEIEVSFSVVNQIAQVLDTTTSYILGIDTDVAPIRSLADVLGFLFELEKYQILTSILMLRNRLEAKNGNVLLALKEKI